MLELAAEDEVEAAELEVAFEIEADPALLLLLLLFEVLLAALLDELDDATAAMEDAEDVAQRAFLRIKLVTCEISPRTSVASETSHILLVVAILPMRRVWARAKVQS